MHLGGGGPADLGVVLAAGVILGLRDDRRVAARDPEILGSRESSGVGLKLEVALVLEPVAHVDHEAREQHEDGQPERDHDENATALVADARQDLSGSHVHPAE